MQGAWLAVLGGAMLAGCSPTEEAPRLSGRKAADFRLLDETGAPFQLSQARGRWIVLLTQLNGDTASREEAEALAGLQAKYPDAVMLMMNSSLADDADSISAEAQAQGFRLPVLNDETQLVAEALGVRHAGEAFLIDRATRAIVYHGPVEPDEGGLDAALQDLKAGRPVAIPDAEIEGGAVLDMPWLPGGERYRVLDFSRDVSPVLNARCVACHGPIGQAPKLDTEASAQLARAAIVQAVLMRHPEEVADGVALTSEEARTLGHWAAEAGPRP